MIYENRKPPHFPKKRKIGKNVAALIKKSSGGRL